MHEFECMLMKLNDFCLLKLAVETFTLSALINAINMLELCNSRDMSCTSSNHVSPNSP